MENYIYIPMLIGGVLAFVFSHKAVTNLSEKGVKEGRFVMFVFNMMKEDKLFSSEGQMYKKLYWTVSVPLIIGGFIFAVIMQSK